MITENPVSPNNMMKQKTLNAARRIKNGSPKIRDVLRQRCRQRIHEKRDEIFLKRRLGMTDYSKEVADTLTSIVHKEFETIASMQWELEQDETHMMEDETCDIDEGVEEQWILEEYQRMVSEEQLDRVVCPLCLKNFLKECQNIVSCDCGLLLPIQVSLDNLKKSLREQVSDHSASCLNTPQFSLFQDGQNTNLCMMCSSCDAFVLI